MPFSETLYTNLKTYADATNISLALLDKDGKSHANFGESYHFSKLFDESTAPHQPCPQCHKNACEQAFLLGDAYIFLCTCELVYFTVPIIKNNSHQGSVLAGPFTLEYPDIAIIDALLQKHEIPVNYRQLLFTAMLAIPVLDTQQARHLSKLLFLLITNLMASEAEHMKISHDKALQQAKIGTYMQLAKEGDPNNYTQYTLEQSLIQDVTIGNLKGAREILNQILGSVFFMSGSNLELIKVHIIELIALLSRACNQSGCSEVTVYQMTEAFMLKMLAIHNLTDLSYLTMATLEDFTNLAFGDAFKNNNALIRKSVAYINDYYNQDITLDNVSEQVQLNPAYFSCLFKKEMGMNFSHYLVQVRIEHAKGLLKNSTLTLSNIAVEVGFDNQSYFSSVFKKATGMTPRQFRQSL